MSRQMLGIIIVHYGNPEWTASAVESVLAAEYTHWQLVVVDNASPVPAPDLPDDPRLHTIKSAVNLGFGAGNNLGAKYLLRFHVSHLLLLNNDAVMLGDALEQLAGCCSDNPEALIAPVVLDRGMRPAEFGGVLDSFRFYFHDLPAPPEDTTEVSYATAACLALPVGVWQSLGGFDERFFMYNEDMDLCIRTAVLQRRILLCPTVRIKHAKGATSGGVAPLSTYYIHRNRFLLAHKYHSGLRFMLFFCYYSALMAAKLAKWSVKDPSLLIWLIRGYIDGLANRQGQARYAFE